MSLEPRDLNERTCDDCDFWRSRISRKKGVTIPGGYGKCTRPEGHCAPDVVRGGIGQKNKAVQVQEIIRNVAEENNQMAKRNLALFRKTTPEPEVIQEEEIPSELDDYTPTLDDQPPDYSEVKPLSVNEKKRRAELEEVITRSVKNFYDLGLALREIQQRRLYRSTHETFADYCKDMWEFARQRAYQMIDAARVVEYIQDVAKDLSTIVDKKMSTMVDKNNFIPRWVPRNEGQARALLPYKDNPEAIKSIVTEAVQTAPEGKVTASHLKKTAKRLHLEKVADTIQRRQRQVNSAPKISEDFRKAFNAFLDAINIERANEYKHTDQKEVIRHVRIILEALEAEI